MSPREIAGWVLLAAGVLTVVVAGLGVLVIRPVFDRLHFIAIGSSAGAPLIGTAAALTASTPRSAIQIGIITAFLAATGPVVTVATARAGLVRGTAGSD